MWVYISDIADFAEKEVTLKGWLYNKRGSGKIQFLQLRDGTGFIQCVLGRQDVPEEMFELASGLSQESSIILKGRVKKDDRAPFCGHELHVTDLQLVSRSHDYPITKKEHG